MKKIVVFFVILTGLVFFANSQNADIQQIRSRYAFAMKQVAGQKNGDLPDNNLTVVKKENMPAMGPAETTYNFYFSQSEYTENGATEHELFFATYKYNVGGFYNYSEFLFDESGNLIFYFGKMAEEGNCSEYRLYLKNGKIIKNFLKENNTGTGDCKPSDYEITFESTKEMCPDYSLDLILKRAGQLQTLFKTIDKDF